MSAAKPKWQVLKTRGMWVVRRPGGAHHGAYFTWTEAIAQVARRRAAVQAGVGGYFDRRGTYDYDERPWGQAFGFVGPVRCETELEARA